ncbi:uncharacterized protein J7T54_008459 [Emericellopsis cladophorae]|uniref:Beta-lactamase-related domain-containing protein n=1 Tax=Emericellopsis cladophorae TaxID=2686198 RepID=A0A9P9Y398_9HYPO|nr:uncharacterized protein J7T54_008459 [Emericellopsis cladophorae]KAI6782373.1 hypothetical protein J7T54_008459 [Emericellopsis cladophorae]
MDSFANFLRNSEAIPFATVSAQRRDGSHIISQNVDRNIFQTSAKKPIGNQTVYALASLTKLPTTVAALQLVEKGVIALDDDVSNIIPALGRQKVLSGWNDDGTPILTPRRRPLTLRHLLTHCAGISYDFNDEQLQRYHRHRGSKPSHGATVDERFDVPLLTEPGESGWVYGGGLDWVGKIVENLSGLSLEEYFKRHLWRSLGVQSFTFWPQSLKGTGHDLAAMVARSRRTGKLRQLPVVGLPFNQGAEDCFGGQGAFCSSNDFMKLLHALLVNDGTLLRRETVDMMFEGQLPQGSRHALEASMKEPTWTLGKYNPEEVYNWGLGGLLINTASNTAGSIKQEEATMTWGGAANQFWFIDRKKGICGLFMTQVLPQGDPDIRKLIEEFHMLVNRAFNEPKSRL